MASPSERKGIPRWTVAYRTIRTARSRTSGEYLLGRPVPQLLKKWSLRKTRGGSRSRVTTKLHSLSLKQPSRGSACCERTPHLALGSTDASHRVVLSLTPSQLTRASLFPLATG